MDNSPETPARGLAADLARPFAGDPELSIFARRDLEERVLHSGATDQQISAAVRRSGKIRNQLPVWRKRWVLWCLVFVVWAAFGISLFWRWRLVMTRDRDLRWLTQGAMEEFQSAAPPLASDLWTTRDAQKEGLERAVVAYPDEPAVYHAYVCWLVDQRMALPADFTATWQRLDPDNAAWLLLQSYQLMQQSLNRQYGTASIISAEEFAQAMNLQNQAARMPKLEFYVARKVQLNLSSYRTPKTFPEASHLSWAVQGDNRSYHDTRGLRYEMDRLESIQDEAAMKQLARDYFKLMALFAGSDQPDSARSYLFSARTVFAVKPALAAEEKLAARMAALLDDPLSWNARERFENNYSSFGNFRKGSSLERAAIFSVVGIMMQMVSGGMLATSLLLGLRLLPLKGGGHRLSVSLSHLVSPWAVLRSCLAGLVVPALWLAYVLYRVPADFELWHDDVRAQTAILSIGVLLMLSFETACRWEADRGVGVVGLSEGSLVRRGRIVLVVLGLISPLGLLLEPWSYQKAMLVTMGVMLINLVAALIQGYFRIENSLRSRVTVRVMIPALLLTSVLLLISSPFLRRFERSAVAAAAEAGRFSWDPTTLRGLIPDAMKEFRRLSEESP